MDAYLVTTKLRTERDPKVIGLILATYQASASQQEDHSEQRESAIA